LRAYFLERGGDERGGRRREEGRGGEAFLVMWPRRLSALNPPLNVELRLLICCNL